MSGGASICGFISFPQMHNFENLLNQLELQNVSSRIELSSSSDAKQKEKVFICLIRTLLSLAKPAVLVNHIIGVHA